MQDFYGDTPFIISNKKRKKHISRGETVTIGVSASFIAKIAFVAVVIVLVAGFMVFRFAFTVRTDGREYFVVCFYDGQDKTAAENISRDLIASGGSGYIVAGGTYKVYGGVYVSRADAEAVAARRNEAFVESVGWKEEKLLFSASAEASTVRAALSEYVACADSLARETDNIVKENQTPSAVKAYAAAEAKLFNEYSAKLADKNLSVLFERAALSLGNFVDGRDADFLSALRYVTQDLIVLRSSINLSKK